MQNKKLWDINAKLSLTDRPIKNNKVEKLFNKMFKKYLKSGIRQEIIDVLGKYYIVDKEDK